MKITLHHGIVPGSKVWFTACWYNLRGQRKPNSLHIAYPMLKLGDIEQRMAA